MYQVLYDAGGGEIAVEEHETLEAAMDAVRLFMAFGIFAGLELNGRELEVEDPR